MALISPIRLSAARLTAASPRERCLEGARLQPCHKNSEAKPALAAEGCFEAAPSPAETCFERARLQPCRNNRSAHPALAAEGCFSPPFPQAKWLKILRALIPAAALLVTSSAAAQPTPTSLKTVLSAARARIEASDERGSGRLVQVAPSGARNNTSISIEARWFPDGLRMLVVIPSARYLLTMEQDGHAAIEVLRKGESAPVRLPADRWGDGVAGTYFSPEDFVDGQFLWSRQTLLPSQPYGARDCYVLRSEPGPGQISQYSSVTTWIDQKTGATVHVEAAQKSGPGKQFIFYDLQQNGGVWVARQIEAKLNGKPGSSLLILDHGSGRAHLQRKDLTLIPANSPRSTPGP